MTFRGCLLRRVPPGVVRLARTAIARLEAVTARPMWLGGLALVGVLALPAPAQRPDAGELTQLADYRLTMPMLRKALVIEREISRDPAYRPVERLLELRAAGNGGSIAEVTAALARAPAATRAIARADLSTREWATVMVAFLDAELALLIEALAREAGETPPRTPSHIPPANVQLLRTHRAELDRLIDGP